MDSSLEKLIERIDMLDEAFESSHCRSIEINPEKVTIEIEIGKVEDESEFWQICASGVQHHQIGNCSDFDYCTLETDHPILLPHLCDHGTLYFNSAPENAEILFAQLMSAQFAITGSWFPIDFFLRRGSYDSHVEFLARGSGMLAVGPNPLIRAFRRALDDNLVSHSTMNWNDNGWDGFRHFKQQRPVTALIGCQSYIVAQNFSATQIV